MNKVHALTLAILLSATAAYAADEASQKPVAVTAKKELTFTARADDDVKSRELWYARNDGSGWGEWQKHGLSFGRDTPIVWAPPEGHWRTYIVITQISGAAMPAPTADTKGQVEFIIDRTAPTASIQYPGDKTKLRGGQKCSVKWNAADPHIESSPITLRWSRGGDSTWDAIAENIPNTGSYEWLVPRDMTTNGQLQILVTDRAANIGNASSAQILVDSIAPTGRILSPAITSRPDVDLTINVVDAGPSGLSSTQLWISRDDGATWTEGPMITEGFKNIHWKTEGDGRYRLALQLIDQAGNSSPTPRGKTEDQFNLLVDSQKPVIELSSANGISDADKPLAGQRRAFKGGDRVQVQYIIKDVYLADNPVNIYLQTEDGKGWSEIGKGLSADSSFRFELPPSATKNARIKVTAIDMAGNVGETVASETFQIDTEVDPGMVGVDLGL
jgi:hypothetical protein